MVQRTTAAAARNRAVRTLAAVGLSALLGACGSRGPSVEIIAPSGVNAQARGDHDGSGVTYTAAVPRVWLDADSLDENAPERYTVVRGDTLWDISDRFLKEPWLWPTIWSYNPQIADPHLIHPGDELTLEYVDGRPSLVLRRNGELVPQRGAARGRVAPNGEPPLDAANGDAVTRLTPRIRSESLNDAVPTIPGDVIRQFLVHPRVVDLKTIRQAPYIVGHYDDRLISATGHQVYARGALSRRQTRYGIYRRSTTLTDPISGETLGYEIAHVADAKLMHIGDPSTLTIVGNRMETMAGDILLPSSGARSVHRYVPRLPEVLGEGRIISLVNAISQSGRGQVVVLNIGADSNIAVGDVLAIEARGGSLIDPRGKGGHERVTLPNIRTGAVMVFETFERVSYALVMESTRPVMMNDIITGI